MLSLVHLRSASSTPPITIAYHTVLDVPTYVVLINIQVRAMSIDGLGLKIRYYGYRRYLPLISVLMQ